MVWWFLRQIKLQSAWSLTNYWTCISKSTFWVLCQWFYAGLTWLDETQSGKTVKITKMKTHQPLPEELCLLEPNVDQLKLTSKEWTLTNTEATPSHRDNKCSTEFCLEPPGRILIPVAHCLHLMYTSSVGGLNRAIWVISCKQGQNFFHGDSTVVVSPVAHQIKILRSVLHTQVFWFSWSEVEQTISILLGPKSA